jgi:N-acyl-D-aspartate/D-glutamate deacylase
MTSLPASRLGRTDLGRVAPGCQADLVVFDPATIGEAATYADPHQYCSGVEYVVVNGQVVIEHGEDTGAAAGRVPRRS